MDILLLTSTAELVHALLGRYLTGTGSPALFCLQCSYSLKTSRFNSRYNTLVGTGIGVFAPTVVTGTPYTVLGIESMTVTTSGAATDIAVVGSLQNTAAFEGVQGFNILRVPDAVWTWEGVNVVWLDSIIAQGQTVLVRAGGAITQREIAYLLSAGYSQSGNLLIPPP